MSNKKMIPCRVCGKLFEPCSYCQSHADIFRWRNFACSRECAAKYINDTIAYRESQKRQVIKSETIETIEINSKPSTEKSTSIKRKSNRKAMEKIIKNNPENSETE